MRSSSTVERVGPRVWALVRLIELAPRTRWILKICHDAAFGRRNCAHAVLSVADFQNPRSPTGCSAQARVEFSQRRREGVILGSCDGLVVRDRSLLRPGMRTGSPRSPRGRAARRPEVSGSGRTTVPTQCPVAAGCTATADRLPPSHTSSPLFESGGSCCDTLLRSRHPTGNSLRNRRDGTPVVRPG